MQWVAMAVTILIMHGGEKSYNVRFCLLYKRDCHWARDDLQKENLPSVCASNIGLYYVGRGVSTPMKLNRILAHFIHSCRSSHEFCEGKCNMTVRLLPPLKQTHMTSVENALYNDVHPNEDRHFTTLTEMFCPLFSPLLFYVAVFAL